MKPEECFFRSWQQESGIDEELFRRAWNNVGAGDQLTQILGAWCDGGPHWQAWDYETPTGQRIAAVRGADTTVYLPSLTRPEPIAAFYALVPRAGLLPSHNPHTWAETPGYDQSLQERDYQANQGEQLKVAFGSQHFVPDFVIASTPTAIDGPPIIDQRGQVLGGNGRSMMILRVLAGVDTYSGELARSVDAHGSVFGLRGAPTSGMVLVRVLAGDYEPADISARLNAAFTQSIDENAGAVSLGKRLPRRVLEEIADGLDDDGLGAAIRNGAPAIISALQDADIIRPASSAEWLALRADGSYDPGRLNDSGVQKLTAALVGALVEDKTTLARLGGHLRDLVERIAPAFLAFDTLENEHRENYSVSGTFRRAMREALRAYRFDDAAMADYYGNGALALGEGSTVELDPELAADAEALAMVRWLRAGARGSRVAAQRKALAAWRALPQVVKDPDTMVLFAERVPSRQEVLVDVLGLDDPGSIGDPMKYLAGDKNR